MSEELDYTYVHPADIKMYATNEQTMNLGLEKATEHLMQHHKEAREYEHWNFQHHPEKWKGWYMVGVRVGKYDLDDGSFVPVDDGGKL